jgi:cell division septal protein FtsQ
MKSNRRTVAGKILLLCVGIGLFVGLIYVFKIGINVFRVKHIEVTGDPVQVEINQSLFVNNILFFPAESTIRELKLANPLIKNVEIRKKFPSTLEFVIYKRIPIARLVTDGITVGIDEENVITDTVYTTQLPSITISIPLARIGATVKDLMVVQAVALINKTKSVIRWSSIEPYETQSIRARTGQTDILITQTGDLSQIVDTLQTLMEGFRIKGTIPKSIDLRFGKPIVQF